MSYGALQWAFDRSPETLDCSERFVLLALAWWVDDLKGAAWPTVGRIQQRTGLSERSVRRALRRLEEEGIITCRIRQGPGVRADLRPNLYLWHPPGYPQGGQGDRSLRAIEGSGVPVVGERGATQSETRGHSDPLKTIDKQQPPMADVSTELSPVHRPPPQKHGEWVASARAALRTGRATA